MRNADDLNALTAALLEVCEARAVKSRIRVLKLCYGIMLLLILLESCLFGLFML